MRIFDHAAPAVYPEDYFGAHVGRAAPRLGEVAVIALQNAYRSEVQVEDLELRAERATCFVVLALERGQKCGGGPEAGWLLR